MALRNDEAYTVFHPRDRCFLSVGGPGPGDQAHPPDERFKADILLVVAHPDDETELTGYPTRVISDEHKRGAVIFGTRGDGGGNAAGQEEAAALGAEREIERGKP
jgi:LmbE family N-acetylglucosaminyl deacetylase